MNPSAVSKPRLLVLRRIGAGLAGFLFIIVVTVATDLILHSTGVFPPERQPMTSSLFLLATAYRLVIAIVGCVIAAWLAPDRPMTHAITLGLIGLCITIAGTAMTWDKGPEFGPKWYPIVLLLTAVPTGWVGGLLERKWHRRH